MKLNLPSLSILKEVTTALNGELGGEVGTALTTIHEEYKLERSPQAIRDLQTLIQTKIAPLIARTPADLRTTTRILKALASYAASHPHPTFEVAEQIGMGIQATIASSPELARRYDAQLKELFGALKSSKAFGAEQFTKVATKLARSLQVD